MVKLENEIAELLTELSTIQDRLLRVLEKKRIAMAKGDAAEISQLSPEEEELYSRLQDCHNRRAALIQSAADHGMPVASIQELATKMPEENRRELEQAAGEAASRSRLLQHQSLANWVLAQKSLLHVSQMLEIIATGGQIKPTYGSGEHSTSRGSLVDQEV